MKPTVYADSREKKSGVIELLKKDASVIIKHLDIADYVISEEVGIERKTADDFLSSLFDGRLFEQVSRIKEAYSSPILLLEGDPYYSGRANENAIRGALSHILINERVPVYFSRNTLDTARTLALMAKREQNGGKNNTTRTLKKKNTLKESQMFLVQSLPLIGPKNAEQLLQTFGNPENVFTAGIDQLINVPGIGKKRAETIRRTLNEKNFP